MPSKKKTAKKRRQRSSHQSVRLPAIPEEKFTPAQRALILDRLGSARPVQDERAVLLLSALARVRRARPEARRPSALRHQDRAAALRVRDPRHRAALEGAIRMGGARRGRRRRASSRRRSATCARAAPRKAPKDESAICVHQGALPHKRVSSAPTSAHAILGDPGMVELVGLLGYYAMVAMTLDVFRMPVAEGTPLPFKEPTTR